MTKEWVDPPTRPNAVAAQRALLREIEQVSGRIRRSHGEQAAERVFLYALLRRAREEGLTLDALGRAAGLTAARVHQITTPEVEGEPEEAPKTS